MLEKQKIKNALEKWIKVQTWHTIHPLDMKRFHKSIQEILTYGEPVDVEDFEIVMRDLINQYGPDMQPQYLEEKVGKFCAIYNNIYDYIDDLK